MKRLFFALAIIALACVSPAVAPPTPAATQTPVIAQLVAPVEDVNVETCTIEAVTDVNIRECGDVSCRIVGIIRAKEVVSGVCSGKWILVDAGYACVPALIGAGGCGD